MALLLPQRFPVSIAVLLHFAIPCCPSSCPSSPSVNGCFLPVPYAHPRDSRLFCTVAFGSHISCGLHHRHKCPHAHRHCGRCKRIRLRHGQLLRPPQRDDHQQHAICAPVPGLVFVSLSAFSTTKAFFLLLFLSLSSSHSHVHLSE